jgi:large repetitive protein
VISNQTQPNRYTITRTYQAIDPSGNTSFATQIITVDDNIAPVISDCPQDITQIAISAAGAYAVYTAPSSASDNCNGAITIERIAGLPSGSLFPIGTNVVTYRATDISGNYSDCSFNVIIYGLPPVIHCPENIVVSNTIGQCGTNVTFAAEETTAIPASTIVYTEDGHVVQSGDYIILLQLLPMWWVLDLVALLLQ